MTSKAWQFPQNIWQFPHSPVEFPKGKLHHGVRYNRGCELLQHWIGHELRLGISDDVKRPGQYDIPDAKGHGLRGYRPVVPADIALFVKDRLLVAGGRVREGLIECRRAYPPLGGGPEILYVGYITFDPDSLIIFPRPPHQGIIGPDGGDRGFPANERYRGPQFGRPWKLRPEQHWYVRHLVELILRHKRL